MSFGDLHGARAASDALGPRGTRRSLEELGNFEEVLGTRGAPGNSREFVVLESSRELPAVSGRPGEFGETDVELGELNRGYP